MTHHRLPALVAGALMTVALAACSSEPVEKDADPRQVDSVEMPALGACRALEVEEVGLPSDATRTVDCAMAHNAETYAVGELPEELADEDYDSAEVSAFGYETCSSQLRRFLGTDESSAMRTVLSWAWFRPSETAWGKGARWYRCDVVGGSTDSASLMKLPESAEGLLQGRPDDKWMVCADGPTVNESPKVPCTRPHTWRAVTTIKLGEAPDAYPGDAAVETKTRAFCSDSVGAYLNYPVDYDFGYTWFHQTEWDAGNRRSICWAKTTD